MYAVKVHQVVTQTSTTNYIPAQTLSIVFTGDMSTANGYWTFNGSEETNYVCLTNDFYQSYHPFDYRLTNRNLSQTFSKTSGVVITTIERLESGTVETVKMDVDTLRRYELCMALNERRMTIPNGSFYASGFWKDDRTSIINAKEYIRSYANYYVNPTNSSGSGDYDFTSYLSTTYSNTSYGGYVLNNTTFPMLSISNLLASVGAPTNYLDYTPYKHTVPLPTALGRIITNTYSIIQYLTAFYTNGPDQIITNSVYIYNGSQTNISGTNGQQVTIISTNVSICNGFSENDYGFKYITNLLAKMILHNANTEYSTSSYSLVYYHYRGNYGDSGCYGKSVLPSFESMMDGGSIPNANYWEPSSNEAYGFSGYLKNAYQITSYGSGVPGYGDPANSTHKIYYSKVIHRAVSNEFVNIPYKLSFYIARDVPFSSYTQKYQYANSVFETGIEACDHESSTNKMLSIVTNDYVITEHGYLGILQSGIIVSSAASIVTSRTISGLDYNPTMSSGIVPKPYVNNFFDIGTVAGVNAGSTSIGYGDAVCYSVFLNAVRPKESTNISDRTWQALKEYKILSVRNYAIENGFRYY